MASRVGLLGGTFDPIHIGHLILADQACSQLGLDEVLLLPAADPPHKQGRQIAPVADRVRMVELAIAGNPALRLSRVDVDRPGPHYTLDTVRLLKGQFPPDARLYFLMGFDSLRDLPKWHSPLELLAEVHLVALTRPDVPIDWNELESVLPGVRAQITLLDMPEVEVASHSLREAVRVGSSIRYLVPEEVRRYIMDKGLYRDPT